MKAEKFDVAVIGGGSAGVTAAIAAGRAGAKTVLVEKNGCCGGQCTAAWVNFPGIFDAWGKQVIDGIGWEIVRKSIELSGKPVPSLENRDMEKHWMHQFHVSPFLYATVCDELLLDAGVAIKYHTMLGAIAGNKVSLCDKDGLYDIEAKIIIDATGDANATKMAGFELNVPDECQPGTLSIYLDGYDFDALDIPSIAANFDEAVKKGEVTYNDTGWNPNFNPHYLAGRGNNSNHICGINAYDSAGRTQIEIAGRKSVMRTYQFLRKQKGLDNLEVKFSSFECGVRETRTIVGDETITESDYYHGKKYPDAVCNSFYPIDLHDDKKGLVYKTLPQGVVPQIPAGALIPKGSHNLLAAGRIISSDRMANSALRVQASCMAIGHAAGVMAALSARTGVEPRKLPLGDVLAVLKQQGAILPNV